MPHMDNFNILFLKKIVPQWLSAMYSGGRITSVKNRNPVFLNLEVGSNFKNDIHMWHLSIFLFLGVYSL